MTVVNAALDARVKKAGLGTVLKPLAIGAGLGAGLGAGTAAIERPMHNVMNTNDPVTEGVGGSMLRTGKYGLLAGGAAGGTLGLLAHLLSKRAGHIQKNAMNVGGMVNRGMQAVGGMARQGAQAIGRGVQAVGGMAHRGAQAIGRGAQMATKDVANAAGRMAPGVLGAGIAGGAVGGMAARSMQQPAAPQPAPMQTPPMPTQAPMQPKMGADKSLAKKAKVVLLKKAMNPLLNQVLRTGAAGAGLGAVGGAIGAGEGRRGQGAIRGALTGGLAGMGYEGGKAGLGAAMRHLAPEGHAKLLALLAKAKAAHPNVSAAGELAVPAALGVAGHSAGKQEQAQAY